MTGQGTHRASSPPTERSDETSAGCDRARQLWLVITRPDKLPAALLAADALASRFPDGCHLLLERTRWWDAVRWPAPWRARFAAIHEFARVSTCRGLRDLPRLIGQLRHRQAALGRLGIARGDLVVCLAGITRLANAVVSACPQAASLLCVPERKLLDLLRPVDRRAFRWATPGWLQNHLAEPLARLHRTLEFKPRGGRGGDGARHVRFAQQPGDIFDTCVAFTRSGAHTGGALCVIGNLPAICCRFPDERRLVTSQAAEGKHAADGVRAVVFFGTPFLLVRNLPVEVYTAHLTRCLEAIHRWFPDHEKIYRPHPAETTESAMLDLPAHGFRREVDGLVAELYLLAHGARTDAVFSVCSTASHAALGLGLNAYTLWRLFPFQPAQRAFFAASPDAVPAEFEISDLSQPPAAYAERRQREQVAAVGPSFTEAVGRAADRALFGPT